MKALGIGIVVIAGLYCGAVIWARHELERLGWHFGDVA